MVNPLYQFWLKKHIQNNLASIDSFPAEEYPFEEILPDIIQGIFKNLTDIEGQPVKIRKNINAALKYLLSRSYENLNNIPLIKNAFSNCRINDFFKEWFRVLPFIKENESLLVRSLSLLTLFPEMADIDYLYDEFLKMIYSADLYVNRHDRATDNIFSALMEAVSCFVEFPVNESEFNETMKQIEQEAKQKLENIKDKKNSLPDKHDKYINIFFGNDFIYNEKGTTFGCTHLLFEILLAETELRRFLFTGLNIPLSYLIFMIALDELGHFSPVVRQAAIRALHGAKE